MRKRATRVLANTGRTSADTYRAINIIKHPLKKTPRRHFKRAYCKTWESFRTIIEPMTGVSPGVSKQIPLLGPTLPRLEIFYFVIYRLITLPRFLLDTRDLVFLTVFLLFLDGCQHSQPNSLFLQSLVFRGNKKISRMYLMADDLSYSWSKISETFFRAQKIVYDIHLQMHAVNCYL